MKFVLCFVVALIAVVAGQYQQYPNTQFQPGYPVPNINDLCSRPGANCNVQSRFAEESSYTDHRGNSERFTRVCDERGCYERRLSNGSTNLSSFSYVMLATAALIVGIKSLIH